MNAVAGTAIVPELIWRGRLHLGDEPGVYGDACYAGLATEWPITLKKYDPAGTEGRNAVFRLNAEDVGTSAPYMGHKVTFWRYQAVPTPDNPYAWQRTQIEAAADHRLNNSEILIEIDIPDDAPTVYISMRVAVDTSMQPGLYDEFVFTRLSLLSTTYYASLGFQHEQGR